MTKKSTNELPILKRHMGRGARYLRPEAIYSLNRVLYELLDRLEIVAPDQAKSADRRELAPGSEAWVVPVLFEKSTRSWHNACVLPHIWDDSEGRPGEEVINEMLWLVAKIAFRGEFKAPFEAAKDNLLGGRDYVEAYELVDECVKLVEASKTGCLEKYQELFGAGDGSFELAVEQRAFDDFKKACAKEVAAVLKIADPKILEQNERARNLVRAVLLVYHGYRIHRRMFIPGVLYRGLSEQGYGEVLDRVEGEPRSLLELSSRFIFFERPGRERIYHQTEFALEDGVKPLSVQWETTRGTQLVEALMLPLYLRKFIKGGEIEKRPVLVIPVHDVWLGGTGFGGLWGCLLCTFETAPKRTTFVERTLPDFRPLCEALSEVLSMSALTTIATLPIVPPYDLVEHFVKAIIHIQDWERISVYRGGKRLYCYRRFLDGERNSGAQDFMRDFTWERCDSDLCNRCVAGEDKRTADTAKRRLSWNMEQGNVWSRELIPELSGEEEAAFRSISLEFEYPKTATVPENCDGSGADSKHELFELAVIQRQIEVLRTLIPKVRARRAALRSAVSAIMGRNMSHNIGSHVLARYSNKIKDDRGETETGKADHRGDFLAYLQRRMDFLAEVATSDRSFWSQPLSMKEQIDRLNYEKEKERFGGHKSIILSNITGKESLLASVEYGQPARKREVGEDYSVGQEGDDVWFSCPGGEVGVHAFFVILENVIRNSARHGAALDRGGEDATICVFVDVNHEGDGPDLLKIEIIDPRSKLEPDGRPLKTEMSPEERKNETDEARRQEKELSVRNSYSLYEADGTRKKLISLHREINSILHDEPFLGESGIPNPKYWGVREMQICAHYLRGSALSDIEGPRDETKPVLEAGIYKLPDGSFCLKYTLYLQRAKLMAAVVRDDSGYRDMAKELRSRGIVTIGSGEAGPDWATIVRESRGYGFLVVEDTIGLPEDRCVRASLPVRAFNWSRNEIGARIDDALSGHTWMERLHRCSAEVYRDRRKAWKDKPLWGVVVNMPDIQLGDREDGNRGGLFSTPRAHQPFTQDEPEQPIRPLPSTEITWHRTLLDSAIAAAWINHPNRDDFSSLARFEHAMVPAQQTYHWVSVESALSDNAHSAYLRACRRGEGWEILAAAVVRVAVLDERVQSELKSRSRSGIDFSVAWPLMGVWVPTKGTCNLDSPELNACKEFLRRPAERTDQFPIDFLIVHLTILERLAKEVNLSLPETLDVLITGTQAAEAEIIVVTGRGVPTVANALNRDHIENVRYLPISALLEGLVFRPSKLALMRVIWSAGRPSGQELP